MASMPVPAIIIISVLPMIRFRDHSFQEVVVILEVAPLVVLAKVVLPETRCNRPRSETTTSL